MLGKDKLPLTLHELDLVADACNGWYYAEEPPDMLSQALALQVHDAIKLNKIDEKWKVDGDKIINVLSNCDALTTFRVIDYVEQYWHKNSVDDLAE
ncbi:MAG: hypothetical protein K2X93_06815 [Candidatus Obscuribacterales bacterium]|nr:hypothetical protein [Candidatus Obscuribacterales bacterium]